MIDTDHLADLGSALLQLVFRRKQGVPSPPGLDLAAAYIQRLLAHPHVPDIFRVNQTALPFSRAIVLIMLLPLLWNLLARLEYHTRLLSTLCIRPIVAVYLYAVFIAALSVYRSALVLLVIRTQPRWHEMDQPVVHAVAGGVFLWGGLMLVGAYYRLGIAGTYLGDYFGIVKKERITAFPYNVMNHPMYDGIAMLHLSVALLERSPAGVALAAFMFFCYRLGCIFEEPFTAMIYKQDAYRTRQKPATGKSKSA